MTCFVIETMRGAVWSRYREQYASVEDALLSDYAEAAQRMGRSIRIVRIEETVECEYYAGEVSV